MHEDLLTHARMRERFEELERRRLIREDNDATQRPSAREARGLIYEIPLMVPSGARSMAHARGRGGRAGIVIMSPARARTKPAPARTSTSRM